MPTSPVKALARIAARMTNGTQFSALRRRLSVWAQAVLLFGTVALDGKRIALCDQIPTTPPLGWNSWAAGYDCIYRPVSEADVLTVADVIRSNRYDNLGWRYLCVDDAMFDSVRDALGNLQLARDRFPHGLEWLVKELHARGLKMGAYLVVGPWSNCGSAGSEGHWWQDGKFVADAGVDFIKISFDSGDYSWGPNGTVYDGYSEIVRGIRASTNTIFVNASAHDFLPWMPEELNSWHTSARAGDANGEFYNSMRRFDIAAESAGEARPGHFIDADFIKFPVSARQMRVEFGMHCLLQGQVLVGGFSNEYSEVLTNADALAINQDSILVPARIVAQDSSGSLQVWAKPFLRDDRTSWAVGFLNRGASTAAWTVHFTNLPLSSVVGTVKDVWARAVVRYATNSFSATVPPMSLALYTIIAGQRLPFSPGTNYLSDIFWQAPSTNGLRPGGIEWPPIHRDRTFEGHPLAIRNGSVTNYYRRGIELASEGHVAWFLGGAVARLQAWVGPNVRHWYFGDGPALVITVDGVTNYDSGPMRFETRPQLVDLSLVGAQRLEIHTYNTSPDPLTWFVILGDATLIVGPEPALGPLHIAMDHGQIKLTWEQTGGVLLQSLSPGKFDWTDHRGTVWSNSTNFPPCSQLEMFRLMRR